MTARRPAPVVVDELYATSIGGYTVAVRGKRIRLHKRDPDADGNLTSAQALALAAALQACAGKARRPPRRVER